MGTSLSIKGYKTFGLRDEWVDEYVSDPDNFWESTLLGTAMFDSFKAWSKDIGILDAKTNAPNLVEFCGTYTKKIHHSSGKSYGLT